VATVVVARELPAAGLQLLRERFDVRTGLEEVTGAVAIVADPTVRVDAELLDAAGPSLKVVANFAVGYDNIDLDACRAQGVVVTNTPDVLTNATAELTVALMLAAARRVGEGERIVRRGEWTGWEPGQLLGRELTGATIGIVGFGRIGARVAELLRGFEPRLLHSSRRHRSGIERRDLPDIVAESDVVTLHVPLSPETRHMIDGELLAGFKPGSILVNTSRGAIVDTQALVRSLREGPLAAAALDVYENEPDVPRELLELENVVLSPHLGSATRTARDGMARLAAENVIAVLDGSDPLTPVP
jgi:lactate dehydrogenase-like 2-hydroxyacid dehydrogenase